MTKSTLKVISAVILIALVFGGIYLGAIYSYKSHYLNKEVPATVSSKHSETIIIDGTIFDVRLLQGLSFSKEDVRKMYGMRKIVHMPAKTAQLINLVKAGTKEITIKLNSGGGLMNVGMQFVRAMKGAQARGVTITCVVDNHAMSMALIIFSECDNRYATFGSNIMWHSIAMTGNMSVNEFRALELYEYMKAQNQKVWANTRAHFFSNFFHKHFKNETIIDVSEIEQVGIGYLRVINKLIITDVPSKNKGK